MEQINIAEILKDCPSGMELYSPLCGECVFDRLNMGTIICKKQNTQEITFTSDGYYMLPVFDNCECMIFPSKENRDWSTFQRPFKDGDVITCTNSICSFVAIFKKIQTDTTFIRYVSLTLGNEPQFKVEEGWVDFIKPRFATEEEKQKLFKAIKDNGYKWNPEIKTLEKLIEPKFKVGDRIKKGEKIATIVGIYKNLYDVKYDSGVGSFTINLQDDWELLPNKFDITTLKRFESKVLVRSSMDGLWKPAVFGFRNGYNDNAFYIVGGSCWKQCIPYLNNEHLCGTTNDCDDYYKTWE